MTDDQTPTEGTDYVHATPGRVMSALAYTLLSQDNWPVYVSTDRNYLAYRRTGEPTDPGGTISDSAHFRPVDNWHPLAPVKGLGRDRWSEIAAYLDDRIRPESLSGTHYGPGADTNVEFVYDEYFIHVSGPGGQNLVEWSDYSGSTWQRSNHRSLLRDYPGLFVEVSYGFGGSGLAIPMFVEAEEQVEGVSYQDIDYPFHAAHYDADEAVAVADVLSRLAHEYPVYDEDDMSELERELQTEAVEHDWFRSELLDAVAVGVRDAIFAKLDERAGRNPASTPLTSEQEEGRERVAEILREMYDESTTILDPEGSWHAKATGFHTITSLFLTMANENYGPTFETAVSDGVVWPQYDETIEKMVTHLTGGN